MGSLVLASLIVMLASLAGVVTVWKRLGRALERNLGALVSFSAGVFLLVAYELAAESVEHAGSMGTGMLWILLGAGIVLALFRLLPDFHHHHDECGTCAPHAHSRLDARRLLLSDALHNIGDGILIATAFSVSGPLGWLTTASVFIHELVQETSEFFVLRAAGYSARRALTFNFLVSSTILAGAIGGYVLLDTIAAIEAPLLGLAAGAFLVVVAYDLIPHSLSTSKKEARYGKHLVAFVLGALLMWSLNAFVSHATTSESGTGDTQRTQADGLRAS